MVLCKNCTLAEMQMQAMGKLGQWEKLAQWKDGNKNDKLGQMCKCCNRGHKVLSENWCVSSCRPMLNDSWVRLVSLISLLPSSPSAVSG